MKNRTGYHPSYRAFLILWILGSMGNSVLYGMDWPSASTSVLNNFGWNDAGRPILGISFEAQGSVQSADPGELIFMQSGAEAASRLPAPLGTWVALDHGDGIISIYSRLENHILEQNLNFIEKDTPIGTAGLSGWSERRGFHFSLFDRKERRWVNPSMIITPLQDTRSPIIQSISLRTAEGKVLDPAQIRGLVQGRYTISVVVSDTRNTPTDPPLAPHRIVCILNGSEIGSLTFDTYSARDGVLMIYRNGLVPVKQVYAPVPGFELGEVWFTRGQATIEIIAQDINGNAQSVVYRLVVE